MKKLTLTIALIVTTTIVHADQTIYAAASMTDAVNEIKQNYEKKYKINIKTSYAASGTLAKQIENGAPADIFISADLAWVEYLQKKSIITPASHKNLLGNRLVLIMPTKNPIKTDVRFDTNFNIGSIFGGKLCTGNTASVPVGKYAKQALTHLGWWGDIKTRLVETEDVRSALNFVARGECQLGIVYATDAINNKNVKVVGVFPLTTHQPIIYPVVLIKDTPKNRRLYQYLQSNEAHLVYKKYGFSVL